MTYTSPFLTSQEVWLSLKVQDSDGEGAGKKLQKEETFGKVRCWG